MSLPCDDFTDYYTTKRLTTKTKRLNFREELIFTKFANRLRFAKK
ncbi:MAG: hypothetical protein PV344_05665 [Anaplasma sp.]|nr:hypothetical protein [Anaplasma sp.]